MATTAQLTPAAQALLDLAAKFPMMSIPADCAPADELRKAGLAWVGRPNPYDRIRRIAAYTNTQGY
jgi:hypothetical protein